MPIYATYELISSLFAEFEYFKPRDYIAFSGFDFPRAKFTAERWTSHNA